MLLEYYSEKLWIFYVHHPVIDIYAFMLLIKHFEENGFVFLGASFKF